MKLNRFEDIVFQTDKGELIVKAKIDTGADRTSIDESLINELGLKPLNVFKVIHNANGVFKRRLVNLSFKLKSKLINSTASIADRSKLSCKVIIGVNDLKDCEIKI